MNTRSKTFAIFSGIIFLTLAGAWIFLFISVRGSEQGAVGLLATAAEDRTEEAALFSDAAIARDAALPAAELSSFFAPSGDVASVIKAIEGTGKSEGLAVSIDSISAGTATTSPLSELSFSVSSTGPWDSLVAFVGSLESLPYDIALGKVSLFRDTGPKGSWHVETDASSYVSN
jgi:hypothetical protein